MTIRIATLASVACVLISASRFASSTESAFALPGRYQAVLETEISAELTLKLDGSARFVVVWLDGEAKEILKKFEGAGRWVRTDNHLSVTLNYSEGLAKIEYEIVPCLSYKSFGSPGCSPGLKSVASELPYDWELWKFDTLRL